MSSADPEVALVNAATAGRVDVVKQLLAAGVDPNCKPIARLRPLNAAIYFGRNYGYDGGHRECAELLVAHGAELTKSIFDDASSFGRLCWIEPLVLKASKGMLHSKHKNSVRTTAMHQATTYNRTAELELLLESGANPNVRNADMLTPIQSACLVRPRLPLGVFTIPVSAGADLSIRLNGLTLVELWNRNGRTSDGYDDDYESTRDLLQGGGSATKGACPRQESRP